MQINRLRKEEASNSCSSLSSLSERIDLNGKTYSKIIKLLNAQIPLKDQCANSIKNSPAMYFISQVGAECLKIAFSIPFLSLHQTMRQMTLVAQFYRQNKSLSSIRKFSVNISQTLMNFMKKVSYNLPNIKLMP